MKLRAFDQAKHRTYVDLKVHSLELTSISILRQIILIVFYQGVLISMSMLSMTGQMENTCPHCEDCTPSA